MWYTAIFRHVSHVRVSPVRGNREHIPVSPGDRRLQRQRKRWPVARDRETRAISSRFADAEERYRDVRRTDTVSGLQLKDWLCGNFGVQMFLGEPSKFADFPWSAQSVIAVSLYGFTLPLIPSDVCTSDSPSLTIRHRSLFSIFYTFSRRLPSSENPYRNSSVNYPVGPVNLFIYLRVCY